MTCFACQIFLLKSQFSFSINVPCVRRRRKGREKSQKPLCVCVSEFFVAQWSSMGVNVFQTANHFKVFSHSAIFIWREIGFT